MSFEARHCIAVGLLLVSGCMVETTPAAGQEEINRKVKTKVAAQYPELAKRMNITGVVKLQVTVAMNGSVKDARVVGGNPVLAEAAIQSIKKWRYEQANVETTGIVEFNFVPGQ